MSVGEWKTSAPKGIIFDLDGVLESSHGIESGAIELISNLIERSFPFVIFTNDIRADCYARSALFADRGLSTLIRYWFTPYDSLVTELRARNLNRPYFVGDAPPSQYAWLTKSKVPPDCVVLGDVRSSLAQLKTVSEMTASGLPLFALQKNRILRLSGSYEPDVGYYVAAWEYATASKATIVGKPGRAAYRFCLDRLMCGAKDAVMLSDSVDIDLAGAEGAGIPGFLYRPYAETSDLATFPEERILSKLSDVRCAFCLDSVS